MTSPKIGERIARDMDDIRPGTAFAGQLGPPHVLAISGLVPLLLAASSRS